MVPRPCTTSPSTGQISCGRIDTSSPTAEVADRHIFEGHCRPPVRERRDPRRQRAEHRGRLHHGELLQRLPAGQHQHDNRPGEILAEERRGDDRDTRQVIRAELAVHRAPGQAARRAGCPRRTSTRSNGRSAAADPRVPPK